MVLIMIQKIRQVFCRHDFKLLNMETLCEDEKWDYLLEMFLKSVYPPSGSMSQYIDREIHALTFECGKCKKNIERLELWRRGKFSGVKIPSLPPEPPPLRNVCGRFIPDKYTVAIVNAFKKLGVKMQGEIKVGDKFMVYGVVQDESGAIHRSIDTVGTVVEPIYHTASMGGNKDWIVLKATCLYNHRTPAEREKYSFKAVVHVKQCEPFVDS